MQKSDEKHKDVYKKIDNIILLELNMDSRYILYCAFNVKSLEIFKNSNEYQDFTKIFGDLLTDSKPNKQNDFNPLGLINLKLYMKSDEELNYIFPKILNSIFNLLNIPYTIYYDLILKLSNYEISEKYNLIGNILIINEFEDNTKEIKCEVVKLRQTEGFQKEYYLNIIDANEQNI